MTPLYSSPKWHRGNVVGVGFFYSAIGTLTRGCRRKG